MLGFVPLATTGFAAETALSYVNVSVTGVSATGSVGTALPAAGVIVSVTGISATGSVGTALTAAGATVYPDGVYANGFVGLLPAMLAGVQAVGSVSSVLVWSVIVNPTTQTPNWVVIPT